MRATNLLLLASASLLPTLAAAAQSTANDTSWDKSYPLSGRPTLHLEVGDSALAVHSCAGCNTVHIHVTAQGTTLSRYHLEESANGNAVSFSLKEKPGFTFNWHHSQTVRVDVETPADLTLDARAADGGISLRDLRGTFTVSTSDGAQTLDNLSGDLHLHGSDGGISLRHCTGSLEARLSDGSLDATGAFSALNLRTADGSLSVQLDPGSRLTAPSTIESSDGSVSLRLPPSFPADLTLHTSDGSVQSALPLTVTTLGSSHDIHGQLDGGGASLTIRTSDGSIKLDRL